MRLHTRSTTLEFERAGDGSGLVWRLWAPDGAGAVPRPAPANSFLPAGELDAAAYPVLGTRHVHHTDLVVDHGDGLVGARVRLTDVRTETAGTLTRLIGVHLDSTGSLEIETTVEVSSRHDVVRRRVRVTNRGDHALRLERALAGSWCLPTPPGRDVEVGLEYLSGGWCAEFGRTRSTIGAGEFVIGSRAGITSHEYSPWLAVRPDPASDLVWSFAHAWPGSWQLGVEVVPLAPWVRVFGGAFDDATVVHLEPGETFESPDLLGLVTRGAPDDAWPDYFRDELARDHGEAHRPLVYNSWYATGFDVRVEHQLRLAEKAAAIGVEAFVLDDGWFRGRVADTRALGDWTPDPDKFPEGLAPLADGVAALGMRFGLWVEPEAVNPDSDLFRAHPEWVYRAGERELVTQRQQYVLDFGRPEVVEWAKGWLRDLLADGRITFLKWDMNRVVSDGGRPGDPRGRAWSLQHAAGYLEVMDMLREEFPAVTVEACSGGGGRIDPAVLARSDVVWTSDETGPRDRLAIQHGFLSVYPASVNSSWLTDMPDQRDTEPASLEFRFCVAMCGAMGIGKDLLACSEAELARLAELVGRYQEVRETIHGGRVRRLGHPRDEVYAVEFRDENRRVTVAFGRGRPAARTLANGARVEWALAADADLIVEPA